MWDDRILRSMIWHALMLAKVSTRDLVHVFCSRTSNAVAVSTSSAPPGLTRADFVRMVQRFLRNVEPATFAESVVPVAEKVFVAISGKHDTNGGGLAKRVDTRELERWLRASDTDPEHEELCTRPKLHRSKSGAVMTIKEQARASKRQHNTKRLP